MMNLQRITFGGVVVITFLVTALIAPFVSAQSGIGIGLALSGPHSGGLSLRYKGIQVLIPSIRGTDDGFTVDAAVRYSPRIRNWKRARIHAFGQIGRRAPAKGASESALIYRFTTGLSTDVRLSSKPSFKGLVLSADAGISFDHLGNFSSVPALGLGLHVFF